VSGPWTRRKWKTDTFEQTNAHVRMDHGNRTVNTVCYDID